MTQRCCGLDGSTGKSSSHSLVRCSVEQICHCSCLRLMSVFARKLANEGRREKRLIFQVLTANMNLSEEVDLEDYVSRPEKVSGAESS